MTEGTRTPARDHGLAGPPDAPRQDTWSVRHAALAAGAGLLAMAALAGVGYGLAVQGLVTEGDPARTAADLLGSQGLFRLGIVSLYAVVALDVVVAWGLYRVLRPVSAGLSALAAAFRLVYAAVFLVAVGQLPGALDLLTADEQLAAFETGQVQSLALVRIDAFTDLWNAGLAIFGLHLLLVGYLVWRSGFAPRLLGALLVVAGLGYTFDSVSTVLSAGTWPSTAVVTFVGEVLLAVWLLVRAGRLADGGRPVAETRSNVGRVAT